MERLLRQIRSYGSAPCLLPVSDHQRPPVRAEDIRSTGHHILPGQLLLRVGGLPVLWPAQRHSLHHGVRPVRRGHVPVYQDHEGADHGEQGRAQRAAAGRGQQAGPAGELQRQSRRTERPQQ